MRSALLPTPGDPASLRYWLANYATWRDEVDELIVYVNGQRDADAVTEDRRMIEAAGGRMVYTIESVGHHGALIRLLNETRADLVVLCEDDAYLRHPGFVAASLDRIEAGHTDIIGAPRSEDYFGQFNDWGPYTPGDIAELRNGLWPTFLCLHREDILRRTDHWLLDRHWYVGDMIDGWGVVTPEACAYIGLGKDWLHLDSFFSMTFQLRAAGLRTELVHHTRLFDAPAVVAWVAEDPPWCHITNLSTLESLTHDPATLPDFGPGGGLWTRRVAWWRRMGVDVRPFVERAGIDEGELAAWDRRFAPWITWEEAGP